ncbi:hypothetical protein [Halalkalicoccus salilacus]|uniref:hypothetical protein n=1 Tax=Halalkalicoccus salilacus TaxID=3117459 RepID=UPI00300F4D4C
MHVAHDPERLFLIAHLDIEAGDVSRFEPAEFDYDYAIGVCFVRLRCLFLDSAGRPERYGLALDGVAVLIDHADDPGCPVSGLRRSEELEEEGAWAIADHDHVTNRIERLIEDGEHELYVLVADEGAVDRRFCERLAAAADRGLVIVAEVPSEDVREQMDSAVPSATVAVTALANDPAEIEGKWLGRIVMVDRRAVVISAMTEATRPGQVLETAIWADGPDHGLVVGMRHLLGARIDDPGVRG